MFTGIIEEIGSLKKIVSIRGGKRLFIAARTIIDDLKIGDSVAVCGVCLTVTGLEKNCFIAEAVGETITKTTIKQWAMRRRVNLERAVKVESRWGGHFVQGHVSGLARVASMKNRGENWYLQLAMPPELEPFLVREGSIAIDGVSLTIADLSAAGPKAGISIIPHTFKNTVISGYKAGQLVNIETDFLARYVGKLVLPRKTDSRVETFSGEWFKNLGY
jgi:riboflavin synthase